MWIIKSTWDTHGKYRAGGEHWVPSKYKAMRFSTKSEAVKYSKTMTFVRNTGKKDEDGLPVFEHLPVTDFEFEKIDE